MRSLNKADEPNSPESSPDSPEDSPACTSQNTEAPPSKQPLYSVERASTSRSEPLSPILGLSAGQKEARSGSAGLQPLFMQRGNAKGLTLKCVNLTAGHLQVNDTENFMTSVIES